VDADLELAARYRDRWPELFWLPRIAVYRQEILYSFTPESLGDGFRFFTPDPATINTFLTIPDDEALTQTMGKVQSLGFETLWLHGQGAALEGKGLELDLVEYARPAYSGYLWLSGGASSIRHLHSLEQIGGVSAVVIPYPVARDCGCEQLQSALSTKELKPAGVRVELAAPCEQENATAS